MSATALRLMMVVTCDLHVFAAAVLHASGKVEVSAVCQHRLPVWLQSAGAAKLH